MKKFKLVSAALLASAVGLSSCSLADLFGGKSVLKVDIVDVKKNVYDNMNPFQLDVKVEVKGDAEKTVTWKSSNESVATVDKKGVLTPKKAGKVEITATSTKDSSKKDKLSLNILPGGSRAEFINEGYDYSQSWPAKVVNSYVGKTLVDVEGDFGFYYLVSPKTSKEASSVTIISECNEDTFNAYNAAVTANDLFYFYDEKYDIDCFMDQQQTFELDFYPYDVAPEDSVDYDYVYILNFYHVDEIWESSENTTDTDWSAADKEKLAIFKVEDLPFVTLGENYEFEYDSENNALYISDYCADFTKLQGYDVLLDELYTQQIDPSSGIKYWTKSFDEFTETVIYPYFGYYGNSINIGTQAKELNYFPQGGINTLLSEDLDSIVQLPNFEVASAEAMYMFQKTVDGNENPAANVYMEGCTEAECLAYVGTLISQGFEQDVEQTVVHEDGYTITRLQKGKIIVDAMIAFGREATPAEIEDILQRYYAYEALTDDEWDALTEDQIDEYFELMGYYFEYLINETMTIIDYSYVNYAYLTVSVDPNLKDRTPGVYVDEESVGFEVGETHVLEPYLFELASGTIVVTSADDSIVSVSGYTLTAVAEGTTEVTVAVQDTEYEVVIPVTVTVPEPLTD